MGGIAGGQMRRISNVEIPLDQDKGFLDDIMDRIGLEDDKPEKQDTPEPEKVDDKK